MAGNYGYAVDQGWKGMLAELGLRHDVVLRSAGLPEDLLNRPDMRVRPDQFVRFCTAVEELAGDPAVAVRIVDLMSAEWFSPPLFAALCSPDLTVAAGRLACFKPLIAPLKLQVDAGSDGLVLTYRWLEGMLAPPALMHGVEALFVVKLARMGTRHHVCPVSMTVPVLPDAVEAFEAFAGVSMTQGDTLSVSFSDADAQRPFLTANNAMWDIFEPELRRRLADLQGSATFQERTRAVLLEAMPSGQVSVEGVAKRLAVSARTLQRRLREEGTSFKEVVRSTRESLARHYLGRTRLTASEIAYLLGFEEPSSFFRAFHDWTGKTPETVRQALAQR
ncbi:MAG: AraC family transcriptional regulator [Myxococcales bacterium]|nr:AraC family transcriptional regulator [Myxococcales bacterium]